MKILCDWKLFAADKDLKLLTENFYTVLQIIREEKKSWTTRYDISKSTEYISILKEEQIRKVNLSEISDKIAPILKGIKSSSATTFSIPEWIDLMQKLNCEQLKAGADSKDDLKIIIHDRISPVHTELWFSIKSLLGSPATLLNAGDTTNFVFEVSGYGWTIEEVNQIEWRSKIQDRIKAILNKGWQLNFSKVKKESFKENLEMIDSSLPEILGRLLIRFYTSKISKVEELVNSIANEDDRQKNFYSFKIKHLLGAVALGMVPSKPRDWYMKAHGWYLIVKENGEIACYHIYNMDQFHDYLFENTRFETGSTTRHQFAKLYEEDGKLFFNLNLQIRFL